MDHYRFLKRLEKKRIEIRSGMNFYQETKEYGGNRFTNFYWLEVNKGKYQIELKTADKLLPLKDFEKDNPMVLGGMNFGSFFLVDEACDPKCRYYNLVLSQGAILQLPSNSRTALQCNQSVLSSPTLNLRGERSETRRWRYPKSCGDILGKWRHEPKPMYVTDFCTT